MGDVALPYLYDIQAFDDEQQKAYVELLIWEITDPPLDYADLRFSPFMDFSRISC